MKNEIVYACGSEFFSGGIFFYKSIQYNISSNTDIFEQYGFHNITHIIYFVYYNEEMWESKENIILTYLFAEHYEIQYKTYKNGESKHGFKYTFSETYTLRWNGSH